MAAVKTGNAADLAGTITITGSVTGGNSNYHASTYAVHNTTPYPGRKLYGNSYQSRYMSMESVCLWYVHSSHLLLEYAGVRIARIC